MGFMPGIIPGILGVAKDAQAKLGQAGNASAG